VQTNLAFPFMLNSLSSNIWKLVPGNEHRHLCSVCNHMSYNWKDYDIHAKTHTFAEHLKQY
ncbi:MAG TPA: hypothetical protein VEL11_00380, partial [Candidatus Bathyarchaeia archaeon]|nr:hypothetical protein [Candidatus Bathyarchaeia archaeon]